MNKKSRRWQCGLLATIVLIAPTISMAQDVPNEAWEVAQQTLDLELAHFTEEELSTLGLDGDIDLAEVYLDTPYPVYRMRHEQIVAYAKSSDASPQEFWRLNNYGFHVMYQDKFLFAIRVSNEKIGWHWTTQPPASSPLEKWIRRQRHEQSGELERSAGVLETPIGSFVVELHDDELGLIAPLVHHPDRGWPVTEKNGDFKALPVGEALTKIKALAVRMTSQSERTSLENE